MARTLLLFWLIVAVTIGIASILVRRVTVLLWFGFSGTALSITLPFFGDISFCDGFREYGISGLR